MIFDPFSFSRNKQTILHRGDPLPKTSVGPWLAARLSSDPQIPRDDLLSLCLMSDREVLFRAESAISEPQEDAKDPKAEIDMTASLPSIDVPLSFLKLLVNADSDTDLYWCDTRTHQTYKTAYRASKTALAAVIPDDEARAQWLHDHTVYAYSIYRPGMDPGLIEPGDDDEDKRVLFNRYSHPTWRRGTPDHIDQESQRVFSKFLTHLVPDKSQRDDLKNWIADMIWDMAHPYLFLISPPHTGKSLLINILSALVGRENTHHAQVRYNFSGFDASMAGCRLWVAEEKRFSETDRDRAKHYNERTREIYLEEKFQPVRKDRIWASSIHTNNYPHQIYLTKDDRKFFCPDLTTTKFNAVYDEEGRQSVDAIQHDDLALYSIAVALQPRVGKSKFFNKETATFNRICYDSLPEKLRIFLNECKKRKQVSSADRVFKRINMSYEYLRVTLESYTDSWGISPVTFTDSSGATWAAESNIFEG